MRSIPTLEELKESLYIPPSRFKEMAEQALAESDVLRHAKGSKVYERLWGSNTYAGLDGLGEVPVLTPDFYTTNFEERDPRVPIAPVSEWLCSTGTYKGKFLPFSDNDKKRIGAYGMRAFFVPGIGPDDDFINLGAEPPHCSATLTAWSADAYGNEYVTITRGMRPQQLMAVLIAKAPKIRAVTGVPLIAIKFLETLEKQTGRQVRQLFPQLEKALLGGESLKAEQLKKFKEFGITPYSFYASLELSAAGIECQGRHGMHLLCDENIYALKLDDELRYSWEWQPGDIGTLIATTPDREAFPLINYNMRDVIEVLPSECPHRISHPPIRIISREDDIMNIGGAKFYPQHIIDAVERVIKEYKIENWQLRWTKELYHKWDIILCGEGDKRNIEEDLLKSFDQGKGTKQLAEAIEAGILSVDVQPMDAARFAEQCVQSGYKSMKIVKAFK